MNKKKWKDFQIGGESGVFSIKSSISQIDKKNLNTMVGNTPYVTRTNLNNGVSIHVTKNQDKQYVTNEGNVISIGLDTQTVFYQPDEFYTGQNIQILSHENMNINIAQFLVPLLKIQVKKFSWGGNGATLKRLNNLRIMLPVDDNNKPDWQYMNDVGNNFYQSQNKKVKEYLLNKKDKLEKYLNAKSDIRTDDIEWRVYEIEELFDTKRVSGSSLGKYNKGNLPFVSTSSEMNGIQDFIKTTEKDTCPASSLTISPIEGTLFYQPHEFVGRGGAGSSITSMANDKINKYIGLFLKVMIEHSSKAKASYGVQLNGKRLKSTKFNLPVTTANEPDWDYMEHYMKKIEYKKIIKLIEYLN